MAAPSLTKPTFEHHHSGLGVGYSTPRISWRFETASDTAPSWTQTSYEIEVTWLESGEIIQFVAKSESNSLVPWPTRALQSRDRARVRVRSHGVSVVGHGSQELTTPWSPLSELEVGLLSRDDWCSKFIASSTQIGPEGPLRPLRFVKQFMLPTDRGEVARVRLYSTCLGLYNAYLNGRRTSDEQMAPGWTSYRHRLNYQVQDVTSLITPGGENVIGLEVAEGWYAGLLGMRGGSRFIYGGDKLAINVQLEVHFKSEAQPWTLVSDDSWACSTGPIVLSEIYNGEEWDYRDEEKDWNTTNTTGTITRSGTKIIDWPQASLVSPDAPPVRITEVVEIADVFQSRSGKTIIDFGRNVVGKILVKCIDLPAGEQIVFKHAEVMEHGELGTRPLRLAKATDTVISAGEPILNWTPEYTFHGFRYVQVDNWPRGSGDELLDKANFTALVMYTDMERTGDFKCSNPYVNQLHQNIVSSMKGNFLSVPIDCPQRNERLGWTADLQIFAPTANFLYNTTGMLKDWLQDLSAAHLEEGTGGKPPFVCPPVPIPVYGDGPAAVWDDTTVLLPYTVYESSGDPQILGRQYESMRAWLEQGLKRGDDGLWDPEQWQPGDWLDPKSPPEDPSNNTTDEVMLADAYLVHTTRVFAKVCKVIGRLDDAERYSASAQHLLQTFQDKYISSRGNLMSSTQTGIAIALRFSLYRNSEEKKLASKQLIKLVRKSEFRIATGFVGTPAILHALTQIGQPQLAYRMLLEKKCPSWLYPVTMGATTLWERWDSMMPDGSINPGQMTSFNHYALGAVAEWIHESIGGISPLTPGWKIFHVRPIPGGSLTSAHISFNGPNGMIRCSWELDGSKFKMSLVVPPNSSALVTLPSKLKDNDEEEMYEVVQSGTHEYTCEFAAALWPPIRLLPPFRLIPPFPPGSEESIA